MDHLCTPCHPPVRLPFYKCSYLGQMDSLQWRCHPWKGEKRTQLYFSSIRVNALNTPFHPRCMLNEYTVIHLATCETMGWPNFGFEASMKSVNYLNIFQHAAPFRRCIPNHWLNPTFVWRKDGDSCVPRRRYRGWRWWAPWKDQNTETAKKKQC